MIAKETRQELQYNTIQYKILESLLSVADSKMLTKDGFTIYC